MANTARTAPASPEQPFHMGDRIRKARELTGMDRQTFASTVGIHRDTLAKYEDTGVAKRSALISVAWNTPVRLEWLETGALPWLKNEKGPEGGASGPSLPHLDSNQEPIGSEHARESPNVTHVTFGRPIRETRGTSPRPIARIGGTR